MKIIFSFIASLISVSLIAGPQAIVFDFGDVMTTASNRNAVIKFICESFGFTEDEFGKVNVEKRAAIKQGMTDEDFWLSYAQQHKIQLPLDWRQSFKEVMKSAININPNMYVLVEELRPLNIPIALLSNIDKRLAGLIREFGLYKPFNPCLLSCEIGIEKPDPRAFEFLLKELNLPATEVVFIDDKTENVEAAKMLGIDAILFESEELLRVELAGRKLLSEDFIKKNEK